jgi:Protein of unknown function (DUF1360)
VSELVLAIIVVGFAAYRLARAIAFDSITDPFRYYVAERAGLVDDGPPTAMRLKRIERHGLDLNRSTLRGWKWFYGLVSCPHCCGWWLALGLFLAWQGWSWTNLLAAVAAAGFQSALTSFARL